MITYLKEDSNEQVNPILNLEEKSSDIKEKVSKRKKKKKLATFKKSSSRKMNLETKK